MINWNTLKLGSILFGATRQQILIQRQITYTNLLLKNKKENIIVFNFNKLRDIKKNEEDIKRIANFEKKLDLEKKLNVDKKIKEKKSSKNKNYIFQNKGGNWESENYRERKVKDKFKGKDRICEKEGEKFYRVFGFWKCLECKKKWESSKTWILLEKWRNGVPFSKINEEDLIQQKCPKCNNEINKISLCKNLQEKDLDKASKRKEKIEKKDKKKPTKWLEDRIESLENKKENLSEKSLNKLEVLKKALQKINDQNLDVKS